MKLKKILTGHKKPSPQAKALVLCSIWISIASRLLNRARPLKQYTVASNLCLSQENNYMSGQGTCPNQLLQLYNKISPMQ